VHIRGINVDKVISELKGQGAFNIETTLGTRGLHIDFDTVATEVKQYMFIKFDE